MSVMARRRLENDARVVRSWDVEYSRVELSCRLKVGSGIQHGQEHIDMHYRMYISISLYQLKGDTTHVGVRLPQWRGTLQKQDLE